MVQGKTEGYLPLLWRTRKSHRAYTQFRLVSKSYHWMTLKGRNRRIPRKRRSCRKKVLWSPPEKF